MYIIWPPNILLKPKALLRLQVLQYYMSIQQDKVFCHRGWALVIEI